MRVLHVSSEVAPWSETGGLGQVSSALPDALASAGIDVHVVTPLYPQVRHELWVREQKPTYSGIDAWMILGGVERLGKFLTFERPGKATVHFLECDALFDRDGIYYGGYGPHGDNPQRFGFLSRAALDGSWALMGDPPDIVHAHDWQTSLVPMYSKLKLSDWLADTRSVLTIHNMEHQGVCHKLELPALGFDWSTYHHESIEFWDQLNFLKAGIAFADKITTVSPQYAAEILTPEFGCNLDGFLNNHGHKLSGILNGIDVAAWNPKTDRAIAKTYAAGELAGKAACRAALLAEAGMTAAADDLVLGVVSRLADQKGLDVVADLVPELVDMGVKLIILGSGDPELEDRFRTLGSWYPNNVWIWVGFNADLAHRIYAGADAVVIPSRFEPCGLSQMYAMRYGAIPIAHAVGGLRDTVVDWGNDQLARGNGTGIRYEHASADGLRWAVGRAVDLFRNDPTGWKTAASRVMQLDWSWGESARKYVNLYNALLAGR